MKTEFKKKKKKLPSTKLHDNKNFRSFSLQFRIPNFGKKNIFYKMSKVVSVPYTQFWQVSFCTTSHDLTESKVGETGRVSTKCETSLVGQGRTANALLVLGNSNDKEFSSAFI